jgi:hypothetical protein
MRPIRWGRYEQVTDADWQTHTYWEDQLEDTQDVHTPLQETPATLDAPWRHYLRSEQQDQLEDDLALRRVISRALATQNETAGEVVGHQAGRRDPEEAA